MNKSAFIATIIIVLIVLLSIWSYDYYFNKSENSAWDLVPETAALVYEPQNGTEILTLVQSSKIWTSFSELPPFERIKNTIDVLDTVAGLPQIDQVAKESGMLITLNPISGSSFDFLHIIEKQRNPVLVDKLVKYYVGLPGCSVSQRIYNGFTLVELTYEGRMFSYAENELFLWGSYSAFLVEDVIRQLTEDGLTSFRRSNPEAFFNAKISKDAGNIYFNYSQLSRLFTTFLSPASRMLGDELANVGKSSFLDFDMKDESILLTGFSYYNGGSPGFLKDFEAKPSGTSNISLYIPSETAYFLNYYSESFAAIKEKEGLREFVATLNGEVAVAILENNSLAEAEKLFFVRSRDKDASVKALTTYAESRAQLESDTLYYEDYSGTRIVELKDEEFIKGLSRFFNEESGDQFYLSINDMLVFSNSIQSLKKFMLDIETENTWGKSVKKNNFLETTLEESSFSLFVDINKSWNFIMEKMHSSWKDYFEEQENLFRNFDLLAIQFSYTEKKFFTSLVLSHDTENSTMLVRRSRLDPDVTVELTSTVFSKPKIVRNHTAPGLEIILQSTDNQLHLISSRGKVLWSDTLSSRIHGEINQVDMYNNGKLQYAFATDSAIHILDRNGNEIEGYPVRTSYVIDHFNVIDYDRSKNYRIITSDVRGNLYLYDKQGKALSGWNPKALEGKLAGDPFHIRIRGKDCIVVLQDRGRLNVLNRRGEMMPGFPIELGPNIQPVFAMTAGATFSSTVFTFVSTNGLLIAIDLNGKRLGDQQLFRTTRNTRFSIVPERQGKGFVIVAKDIAQFQVLDQNGKEIFRETLISSIPFDYQYYDFGSNRKLYVVTDPEQEFSYLFDKSGNLINNSPIDSKFEISVLFSEINNTYKIYSAYEDKVNIYSF